MSTLFAPKHLIGLLIRFNVIIFVVLVSGFLILAVITLDNILTQPNVITTSPNSSSSTFDMPTINRLQKLNTSANNNNYQTLPAGRTNPFSE